MTQWEYFVTYLRTTAEDAEDEQKELDEWGLQGWELVAVRWTSGYPGGTTFYLKKKRIEKQ